MSNRQRGSKTLSAEDEIVADSVDIVGTGLKFSGNGGTAGQVLQVDTALSQKFQNLVLTDNSVNTDAIVDGAVTSDKIDDDAVTGDKLANDINIISSGYAQFTGQVGGIGLSITNDIDCANTIKTDNLDNRTGNDISVKGNLDLGSNTIKTNTIVNSQAGNLSINTNTDFTTHNITTTSGQIDTDSGVIQTQSGNISSQTGNIFTNIGNLSIGGTLETNTIDGFVAGDISVNRNLALTTHNLGTTSGNISTTSGNISCGGTLSTDTIETKSGGATQLGISSDMAFDTNKSLFFLGTGGIGGGTSSNIQFAFGTFATIQGNNQETIQFPRTSINLRAQSGTGGNITCDGGRVIFRNLPTSATGLGSGQIYNDGGTLKIV